MFRSLVTMLLFCIATGADTCPSGCNCLDSSGFIYCKNLDTLPSDLPAEFMSFSCDYCALHTIPVLPVSYAKIEELFLTSSMIKNITDGAFANLPVLRVLDLKGNDLEELRPEMFKGIAKRMESLHLTSNNLKRLQDIFQDMPNLLQLDLNKNPGLILEDDALKNLPVLNKVLMNGCGFKNVPTAALSQVAKLENLDLGKNNFSTTLAAGVFSGMPELKSLNLDSCHIEKIQEKSFENVGKIKSIVLSFNNLDTIPEKAFLSFYDTVRIVYLNNNQFKSLGDGLLPWSDLTEVHISHNPWHCDCGIKWMSKLQFDRVTHGENVSCVSPDKYQGQPAYNVTVSQDCYQSSYIGIYIAIPLIIILTAVIIFIIVKICQTRQKKQGKGVRYSAVYKDTVFKDQPTDFKV